jgi:aminopeptidase Y
MLGGHSDSVAAGPGINDDGSGTVTLLEVAARLAQYEVKNCVRFAWWAGEEEGLLGSDYYVAQLNEAENRQIRLFMDYDMLASPNYAYQVYDAHDAVDPVGSESLRDMYVAWYKAQGLNYTFIPFDGRSDYVGFIRHGIPGGGVATGAEGVKSVRESEMFGGTAGEWYDHCYHQLCDDVSNLALEAWEVNTKVRRFGSAETSANRDSLWLILLLRSQRRSMGSLRGSLSHPTLRRSVSRTTAINSSFRTLSSTVERISQRVFLELES